MTLWNCSLEPPSLCDPTAMFWLLGTLFPVSSPKKPKRWFFLSAVHFSGSHLCPVAHVARGQRNKIATMICPSTWEPPLLWSEKIPLLRVSGTCPAPAITATVIGLLLKPLVFCYVRCLSPSPVCLLITYFFKVLRILFCVFCPGFVIGFSRKTEWHFLLCLIWNPGRLWLSRESQ